MDNTFYMYTMKYFKKCKILLITFLTSKGITKQRICIFSALKAISLEDCNLCVWVINEWYSLWILFLFVGLQMYDNLLRRALWYYTRRENHYKKGKGH